MVDELGGSLLVFVDARVYGSGVATRLLRADPVFGKLGRTLIVHETIDQRSWKSLFLFLDLLSER